MKYDFTNTAATGDNSINIAFNESTAAVDFLAKRQIIASIPPEKELLTLILKVPI